MNAEPRPPQLLAVLQEGHHLLRQVSEPVVDFDTALAQLTEDMLHTMYEKGGIGLAAPQVGVLKRIIVVDVSKQQTSPHVLVNPVITYQVHREFDYEGCLSVANGQKRIAIKRAKLICVNYVTAGFQPDTLEARGLLARAIQHEIDHLDGTLITDYGR